MTLYDIKYFDVYEILGAFINSHVSDILPNRTGKWIFPEFSNTTSNLPQVTIQLENPTYENDSAGDFLTEDYDAENNVYREYFYKRATAIIHMYVVTGRKQEIEVTLNGTKRIFQNKMLNYYLTDLLKNSFFQYRVELLEELLDFRLQYVESPFENDKNTWVSDMRCEVEYKDIWVNEFKDGDLLRSYSLTTNLNR